MTELISIHPQIDQLRTQLKMAEESRAQMQNQYLELKQKYHQCMVERQMLESIVTEKNKILGAPITIYLKTEDVLKFYKQRVHEKMGVRLNHQGVLIGLVHESLSKE